MLQVSSWEQTFSTIALIDFTPLVIWPCSFFRPFLRLLRCLLSIVLSANRNNLIIKVQIRTLDFKICILLFSILMTKYYIGDSMRVPCAAYSTWSQLSFTYVKS